MTVNYLDYEVINALKHDQVFETAVQATLVLSSIQIRNKDFAGDTEKQARHLALCDNVLQKLEEYTQQFKKIMYCWPDYLAAIDYTQDVQTGEWSSSNFNAGGSLVYTIQEVLWDQLA
jgi:hypothetical protein